MHILTLFVIKNINRVYTVSTYLGFQKIFPVDRTWPVGSIHIKVVVLTNYP